MEQKEIIYKLGERKKMFEDYLELVRRQPRLQVNKDHQPPSTYRKKLDIPSSENILRGTSLRDKVPR